MEEERLDLSRIGLIRESSLENLGNAMYLEYLIMRLGLNNEYPEEQPAFVGVHSGGLKIWQYPNQFAKYLLLIGGLKISSYLEVGCRWGGTFVLTCEFLAMKCGLKRAVAMDIIDSPVKEYCYVERNSEFIMMDSQSEDFKRFMADNFFDMILIDGDHEYDGVKSDYENCRDRANVLVFHDISSDVCPGVSAVWQEFKDSHKDEFEFHEITDQYDEVVARAGMKYLGIGVAIRKSFANKQ